MIMAVLGLSLSSPSSLVAVTAVNGDIHLTRNDLDHKQAYEAAQAGIDDYAFHLHDDTGYWANAPPSRNRCNAVNQHGLDRESAPGPGPHRRPIRDRADPGRPASQSATCSTNPAASMLEPTGPLKGTFRIRSTGYSGKEELDRRHLQAGQLPRLRLLHPARDLGPGHLRRTRPRSKAPTPSARKTIEQGRYTATDPNSAGEYCDVISFVNGDRSTARCTPTMPWSSAEARPSAARRPTRSRSARRRRAGSRPEAPQLGVQLHREPELRRHLHHQRARAEPPPTNCAAGHHRRTDGYKFTGQITICLSGTTMTVTQQSAGTTQYSGRSRQGRGLRRQRHRPARRATRRSPPATRRPRHAETSTCTAPTPAR